MEEKKKGFGESLEAFFAGKGFYIVLFLCVAVIGVSAWAMLTGRGTDVEDIAGNLDMTLSEEELYLPTGNTAHDKAAEAGEEKTTTGKQHRTEEVTLPEEPVPSPEGSAEEEPSTHTAELVWEPAQEVVQEEQAFFMWPVVGETENGYSMTALQYDRTMRDWRTHDGIDIAAALGEQVKAACAGTVTQVYDDEMLGCTVVIEHAGGLVSRYSNLQEIPTVAPGDTVVTGQVIGAVGDTAICESGEVVHLHFAMSLDGKSVDPTSYMP